MSSDASRRGGKNSGGGDYDDRARPPRSIISFLAIAALGIFAFTVLVSLGVWQIERRAWKLDLIARVDARVHAAAVPAPGPPEWPSIDAKDDEYLRVTASGHFEHDRETLVAASTEKGAGYWVLTPLKTAGGFEVLINRGFVPSDKKDRETRLAGKIPGEATVTGLLRMSEPKGAFLRANDVSADRWFSRDVDAIAIKRGLDNYAPYFIDADATPNPGGFPIGGLTIIAFPNNHLVYALTWFALALMVVAGGIRLGIEEICNRRAVQN